MSESPRPSAWDGGPAESAESPYQTPERSEGSDGETMNSSNPQGQMSTIERDRQLPLDPVSRAVGYRAPLSSTPSVLVKIVAPDLPPVPDDLKPSPGRKGADKAAR